MNYNTAEVSRHIYRFVTSQLSLNFPCFVVSCFLLNARIQRKNWSFLFPSFKCCFHTRRQKSIICSDRFGAVFYWTHIKWTSYRLLGARRMLINLSLMMNTVPSGSQQTITWNISKRHLTFRDLFGELWIRRWWARKEFRVTKSNKSNEWRPGAIKKRSSIDTNYQGNRKAK